MYTRTSPYRRTPRQRICSQAIRRYSARDFQHSTALFLKFHNQEVITYEGDTFPDCAKQDTCSPYSYKVEIACMPEHHVAPKGTEQYSTLSDPSTEAPYWVPRTGSSLREYAFVQDEPYSYYFKDYIYNICITLKFISQIW